MIEMVELLVGMEGLFFKKNKLKKEVIAFKLLMDHCSVLESRLGSFWGAFLISIYGHVQNVVALEWRLQCPNFLFFLGGYCQSIAELVTDCQNCDSCLLSIELLHPLLSLEGCTCKDI
jgi:hypothetical protein